jgi:hypothetical protein
MIEEQDILTRPLAQLTTSDEFLSMATLNQFQNLLDILQHPVYKLLELKGFNYHMLDELIVMLKGYGLQDKLKDV